MADMTLPPTEVTDWTDWYKLWALANRYGLLAGKDWGGATDAETYKSLVEIINAALNGTTGGNLLPAVGQGSTVLPAVAEGAHQALIAVNPTDPTAVGTISAQPIEGIVTGGGSIGTVIATVAQGSYGAVKRTVAALAATSILGGSILAFQMAQEEVNDLVTSLDPFADDNDNIMTYTDENGKTYLPYDVIEAVRQKLIEMGAYSSGDGSKFIKLTSTPTYFVENYSMRFGFSVEQSQGDVYALICDYAGNMQFCVAFFSDSSGAVVRYHDQNKSSGAITSTGLINLTDNITINAETTKTYYGNRSGTFSRNMFSMIQDAPYLSLRYDGWGQCIVHYIYDVYKYKYSKLLSNSWKDDYIDGLSDVSVSITSSSDDIYGFTFPNSAEYPISAQWFLFSKQPFSYKVGSEGPWSANAYTVTYAGQSFTAYITSARRHGLFPSSSTIDVFHNQIPYYRDSDYWNTSITDFLMWYSLAPRAGGVEGIEIQEGAIIPSDSTQTLEDYFPTWTGQGKAFNTIKKGVDGTIESIGEATFLPVTLKDTQPVIAGTTMNQTEAQEGTGQDNPEITNDLLPAIQELLEKIINSPDIPTPTIPAGDSGDTPPAEPPLISGSANGLWAIYNPTLQQVQDFGAYLWSENILDQITRMFNSPIDAVIGFHMIYCTPVKGAAKNIKCGYLDTGVSSITVANQYATIDCGTVTVPEYYGTVLDYTATKLALYLPFIGIVPLSTAICMSSTLHIIYRIDVLTGTCLAQVKVIKDNSEAVMYAFEGNCSVQIPLTATTYTGIASALINTVSAGLSVFMGDYISAAGDVGNALGAGMTNLSGTKQSGSLGANAGALGIRIPYLIITHPAAYDAMRYNTQYGYPLNQTVTLGDMTGYTKVKDIHLAGIPCTDDELEMIERLLKDGVIIN